MTGQGGNGEVKPAAGAAPGTPVPAGRRGARRHRAVVGTLFALAVIIGIVAVLAVWANRQALNTDNWTNTSSQVLADRHVQTALSAYAVNQLFSSGVVEAQVKSVLPAQFEGLAGPISGGLQQVAGQVAPKVLASPQAQDAWRLANHTAHATFMKIIEGGGPVVGTHGGVVTLNVRALVDQLAKRLGVQEQVAAVRSKLKANAGLIQGAANRAGITLPSSTGRLVIMRSSQLKTVQDIGSAIRGLALVLPLVSFALYALAVWLSTGRRRAALRTTGWCFAGTGLVTLLTRRVLGNYIIDTLVKNPSNKTAVHDVWTIGTTMLYDIAVALLIFGLILVAAAWLAGHTRPATALRHAMAPALRDRPAVAYTTVYAGLLLLILWGPTPATRQLAYIVAFAVLLGLGVHSLRRQTAGEFPDARPGEAMSALRGWYAERHWRATHNPISAAAEGNGSRITELERLARLHDSGSLTDAEFETEKAALRNAT